LDIRRAATIMGVMNDFRIAFSGSRGHAGTVLMQLESMPGVKIVATADAGDSVALVEDWCAGHGHQPEHFDDHRAMLDEVKPDAVVVCGPFEDHAAHCVDAIERGVHVMTEKPAALDFDGLAGIRAACAKHPDVLLSGMMFSRYDAGFFASHKLVSDGAVGDVRLVNARKSYKLGKRPEYYHRRSTYGGSIPWVGSHAIDWTMWVVGKPPVSVYAHHAPWADGGCGAMERSASCLFTFAGGVSATVSIDVMRPGAAPTHGDDWLRVVGSTGVIEAWPDRVMLIDQTHDGSQPLPVGCGRTAMGDFIDHVRGTGRAMLDTKATIDLTDACLRARQSADEGRVVMFDAPQSR
jgi:predicted dehydrogenase